MDRDRRLEFRLLVLLVCAITVWLGEDRTPSQEVVELVSVVYKPARQLAPEPATAQAEVAAMGPDTPAANAVVCANAAPTASAKRRATPVAQHAQAGAGRAAVRPARTSVATSNVAKASCRPPGCRARVPAARAAARPAGARPGPQPEPPLPALLVPIRNLGLYLQARLGTQPHGRTSTGKRRR